MKKSKGPCKIRHYNEIREARLGAVKRAGNRPFRIFSPLLYQLSYPAGASLCLHGSGRTRGHFAILARLNASIEKTALKASASNRLSRQVSRLTLFKPKSNRRQRKAQKPKSDP